MKEQIIKGKTYVLGNDINTDQIVTAEYMKINPATKDGYKELVSLAMSGLSENFLPFIDRSTKKSHYSIIVAGTNFGCGSSREHAPIALGASGIKAVIAESFARIFFRNCISTGEILPVQVNQNLSKLLKTDDILTIIPSKNEIILPDNTETIHFNDLGDLINYCKCWWPIQLCKTNK
uniref:3-isopropylmalate dehydratase small subunit n=1 Tax=Anunuuluaehu liula TaxID=3049639 RepID=UPI0030031921